MTDPDLDAIRGGASRRALLALPLLAVAGAGMWWLMRPANLGEPELAHRVLIVAGAQHDLLGALSSAGFEADQDSWAAHAGEDLDALIDYADERGYGFLTLVFDEAAPWPASDLDASAPANAAAAAIGIGDMREPGADPIVRFGAPVEGLETSASIRATIGLRAALYDHPDLLRLWDNPTPAQRTQTVQLGALEDRRIQLHARLERQREAAASWPVEAIPEGALSEAWVNFTGLPVEGGVLFERTKLRLKVDDALTPRLSRDEPELMWLASAELGQLDAARPIELPSLSSLALSPNRRFVAAAGEGREVRRWTAEGAKGLAEIDPVGVQTTTIVDLAVSNAGQIVASDDDRLATSTHAFDFVDDFIRGFAWHGEDMLAVKLVGEFGSESSSDEALVFLDVRPAATVEAAGLPLGLRALTVYPEALGPSGRAASFDAIAFAGEAAYVLVNVHDGNELCYLARLEVPPAALRLIERSTYDDSARYASTISAEALRAGEDGLSLRVLGQLPQTRAFMVADDEGWIAWWDDNDKGTLQAAPLTKTGIGEVQTLATLGTDSWSRRRRPHFAGPAQLLVPEHADHALGEAAYLRLLQL